MTQAGEVDSTQQAVPPHVVQAADHALCLLRALVERGSLRVTDAAALLGVVPSTAYRLLATLCHERFAIQEHPGGVYLPGPAVALLSQSCGGVSDTVGLRWLAHPTLERLRHDTCETVSLVVLEGAYVRYVESFAGCGADALPSLLGLSRPAHCSSGGKALLALLTSEELRERYPTNRLTRRSSNSIQTRYALEKELTAIRARGYATDFGEGAEGVVTVGAATVDASGAPLVGVTVAARAQRLDEAALPSLGARVRDAVDGLGRLLFAEGFGTRRLAGGGLAADSGLGAGGGLAAGGGLEAESGLVAG